MGRIVFVVLLASCFATGLGLQCYQCVSDLSVLIPGLGSLPFISNDCSTASFNPDGVETVTVSGSSDSGVPMLKSEYCIKMVISFEGLVGVTIRGGIDSASLLNGGVDILPDTNDSLVSRGLLDMLPSGDLVDNIQNWLQDPPAPLDDIDISLCDANLCNSVSGLGHSNAVLAMAAAVLMATLANALN